MKLVQIDWIDSQAGLNGWEQLDGLESLPPALCHSVGFLVEDAPTHKTLAHSITETQVCGRITIPAVCIRKCRRLHEA